MESSLERINQSVLKFLSPLDLKSTYKTIVEEAVDLVGGDEAIIIQRVRNGFRAVYASSTVGYQVKTRKYGFTYHAFTQKKAFVISSEEFLKVHPHLAKEQIKSSIFIPLSYKNKSFGVLIVQAKTDKSFSDRELEVLKLFGSFASMAMKKSQLYDETKKALEVRDLFITTASHELRTPLTTINGYMQLLKNKVTPENFPHYKWFEELTLEVTRLTSLVNELLAINRIRAGHFQYSWKECYLHDIINRSVTTLHFTYPDRMIHFTNNVPDGKDAVVGDRDKLMQVLINILRNAAKFSPPNTPITIELFLKAPNSIIRITDKGRGISKEDLSKVFDEFYKGQNTTEEGMGIGLYLAKRIVTEHHGQLKISSKINKGTSVEIRLPQVKV